MSSSEFAEYRPLMFSIAYRMTGSVGDAEDIVQEAFLRAAADRADAKAPKSYLATITTRLAIDHLRSARVRRETYLGTWLPEPLVEDDNDPAVHAELADSLSMAFLTLLETLTPAERAVFLLREVFSYDYQAIAEATGKSEAACRQLLTRARQAILRRRPRFSTSRADAEELTSIFLDVSNGGDMAGLLERLAPDVVFYGDSGGNGEVTFLDPVHGRDKVAQILIFQVARARRLDAHLEPATINGRPGLLAYATDGLIAALTFEMLGGQVQLLQIVANPDKLRHIGPVSASWHLRAEDDWPARLSWPRDSSARFDQREGQARPRLAARVPQLEGWLSRMGSGGTVTDFADYRPLMFSIAYRMTGSVSDAEDIVQEAFLRLTRTLRDGTVIESPKAFAATVTTRLAITHQTSARVRRESYVGAWLPEPLIVDENDPADQVEMADSLSMAFLVMLETLTPTERAVLLLHEVFAYDYKEIAGVVGKSEANCRQILTRARRRLHEQPRFESSRAQGEQVARRFFDAIEGGDLNGLLELLAPDATMIGDGGGKAMALSTGLTGGERIARFLLGLIRRFGSAGATVEPTLVNGQPGAIAYDGDRRVIGAFALEIADGQVHAIRSVVNPDKLGHLGPVSDLALRPPRDLPCPAWWTSRMRSWTASRTLPIRGCVNCWAPWSGTCTLSSARPSRRLRSGNTR